jgi:hypothetical protein
VEEEETEEMQEFVEQEMVVSDLIKDLSGKETIFRGSVCKGCGIQLGLKIALQLISNPVLVFSDDHISPIRAFLNTPSIKCSNPTPAAAAIARALNCSVLCYIDNRNTAENLQLGGKTSSIFPIIQKSRKCSRRCSLLIQHLLLFLTWTTT